MLHATRERNKEAVKLLVEADADLNLQDDEGDSAMIVAATTCQPKNLKLLIDAGADMELKDCNENTAFVCAV